VPQSSRLPTLCADEGGAVLVMAGFLLVALLLVTGVAVDAGRLYQAKVNLQKAVDAGALAGVAATMLQGGELVGRSREELRHFLEERSLETTVANTELSGLNVRRADIVPQLIYPDPAEGRPSTLRMQVRARARVQFILLAAVPSELLGIQQFADFLTIAASATADRGIANVVLVLDTSNSMACPGGNSGDDCRCLTPRRTADCDTVAATLGVHRKLDDLTAAVRQFVKRFDPAFDRLSVIPFNIAADDTTNDVAHGITNQEAVRFRPYVGNADAAEFGFEPADIENALANLRPASNTNLADGLIRAYLEACRVSLVSKEQVSYVVFSDGAPTASRFLFTAPPFGGALPSLPVNDPVGAGAHDYSLYTLTWTETAASGTTTAYAGPSTLIPSQMLRINESEPAPPAGVIPACSPQQQISAPSLFPSLVVGCLRSFEAHAPLNAGIRFGGDYRPQGFGKQSFARDWRELFYNNAIELADHLRREGGRVFVIGLGTPAAIGSDPYQGLPTDGIEEANLSRKDILLARLANDYEQAVVARQLGGKPPFPEFTYQNYRSYEALQNDADPHGGRLLTATNSSYLDSLFEEVATQILLRLVQ
jgi:hypothetical protein